MEWKEGGRVGRREMGETILRRMDAVHFGVLWEAGGLFVMELSPRSS